jgi:Ca2+-binding RTX toxin-like protein
MPNIPISGDDFDNLLVGTSALETIDGKGGNDIISGVVQGDTLIGGLGNDRFDLGTQVPLTIIESTGAGSGTDTIISAINRSLVPYANVENLALVDVSSAIIGTGNAYANVIVGNSFDNFLAGGAGGDQRLRWCSAVRRAQHQTGDPC